MKLMEEYIREVKSRLKITDVEFDEIMQAPAHQHTDYWTDKFAEKLSKLFIK